MADLTAAARKALPKKDFGEPGSDKYPMENWQHAAAAKSRAKQMLNRGKLSRSEYDKICAKANKIMAEKK